MNHRKIAVILINVGSPVKPEVKYVKQYLTEFLNDRRVIDIPWLLRKFLVNCIIIPFRKRKSTGLYKKLWTENGSPLIYTQNKVAKDLNTQLDRNYTVYSSMRYSNPNVKTVLNNIKNKNYNQIIVVPMYPQYASSTTGSVYEAVMNFVKNWEIVPEIRFINQFYDHKSYINAFTLQAKNYNINEYDHIIFSYHGLPDRQIIKSHPSVLIENCNCEEAMPEHGTFCYKATCYETSRLLAQQLNIPKEKYTVAFQSRLSKNWLTPFTNDILAEKAISGIENILVFSPAFVTDCLETIIEIGDEYKELFEKNGGKKLTMVESLNDSKPWIEGLKNIILNQ